MAFELFSSTLLLTLLSYLLQLSSSNAQQPQFTSPHGIVYENPVLFPPSAYDFFHPNSDAPATPPLPETSSKARADAVVAASVLPAPPSGRGAAAAGVAAIVLGLAFITVAVMVASYVVIRHRADVKKASIAAMNADA
ncbi:hypothetical protein Cni_G12979 [Canna indica]|uniref:Uncharacterized protein n=1 Tax=Canna indica TaxID=4628 RepID=A0AAQ3QCP8_9LILI|nr:hypothetical protein Cni_G12979 [Canna indica]